MPGALTANDRTADRSRPIATPEADKPSRLEGLLASLRVARADTTGYDQEQREAAYSELIRTLNDLGYSSAEFMTPSRAGAGTNYDKVFATAQAERANGHFKDLPANIEAFEQQWKARANVNIDRQEQIAAQTDGVTRFVGGVAGAMTDPFNALTLPIGGFGKTVAGRIVTEAVANMAIEAASQPIVAEQRRALGRDALTGDEAIRNIVFAGVGAGALRGGIELAPRAWDGIKAAPRAVQEKAWAAILDRTPGLREKVGSEVAWDALDPHLADIAEAAIAPENMTNELRGAVAAVRAEARFAQANPFADDAAGRSAHRDGMAAAMRRIMADMDGAPPPSAVAPTRASLAQSTAITSRTVAGDARSVVKARIGIVESGGDNSARNPRSSATGKYQFTTGTWLRLYKNRYGANGLTDSQIAAKRADPRLQEVLMDDLLDLNVRALEADGIPATPGNVYLAHFAGSGGARQLHRADPSASARSVLGDAAVDANPFLARMTARDVIAWAEGKMGDGSAVSARSAEAPNRIEALRDDLATLRAERDAIAREAGAAADDAFPAQLDDAGEDVPVLRGDFAPESPLPEVVRDTLPALRAVVDTPGRSLNDVPALARELGVSEGDLRRGLTELAQRGDISMKIPRSARKRVRNAQGRLRWQTDAEVLADRGGVWEGTFSRRSYRGEDDLVAAIARRGGLSEDGFSADFRARAANMENPPRGHDLRNTGHIGGHFVPGAGPLVRQTGRGIDETIEELWDEGYFGPPDVTPRPTESEFITMLDDTIRRGEKIYPGRFEQGARAATESTEDWFDPDAEAAAFRELWQSAGLDPDELPDDLVREAASRWRAGEGGSPEEVIANIVREEYEVTLMDLATESMDADYGPNHDVFHPDIIEERNRRFAELRAEAGLDENRDWRRYRADGQGRGGPAGERRHAGEGGADGVAAARPRPDTDAEGIATGPIEPGRHSDFDDPNGSAAQAQAESVLHDMRAVADPNVAARERQETQLRAEAPMRGENVTGEAQDGTMGLGLFDAADAPGFRFEEDGPAITAEDLLADLDEDAAMLKSIKDCL